jgi:hypothetical protein
MQIAWMLNHVAHILTGDKFKYELCKNTLSLNYKSISIDFFLKRLCCNRVVSAVNSKPCDARTIVKGHAWNRCLTLLHSVAKWFMQYGLDDRKVAVRFPVKT